MSCAEYLTYKYYLGKKNINGRIINADISRHARQTPYSRVIKRQATILRINMHEGISASCRSLPRKCFNAFLYLFMDANRILIQDPFEAYDVRPNYK